LGRVVVESLEGWGECGVCRSLVGWLRGLPLCRGRPPRLAVVGGVVDRLRWISIASVGLFFLFLDGAFVCPRPHVFAMYVAVWGFWPSVGVVTTPTVVVVASVVHPSSVDLRLGVASFVTGDCVHGLRVL
jgi:hypothetical protein